MRGGGSHGCGGAICGGDGGACAQEAAPSGVREAEEGGVWQLAFTRGATGSPMIETPRPRG